MMTIHQKLAECFFKAAIAAFPSSEIKKETVADEICKSSAEKFGHYQFNLAMKLVGALKLNPRAIAQQILDHLGQFEAVFKAEIAGPGFINIFLTETFIESQLKQLLDLDSLSNMFSQNSERVIVDFSSPNVAKEMHVGHLRSTIIGDCLANVFEFCGADVLRLNHIGDWGTAFGMLINKLKKVPQANEQLSLSDLMHYYKEAKQEFDSSLQFKKESQLEVVKLQAGESSSLKIWENICQTSRLAYQEIYDLLRVELTERGESFYNDMLPFIVSDLDSKNMITISDGAKCIFLEGFCNREGSSLPLIVQKSDGGYNYDTTDMAAIYQRATVEKASRIVYVTDAGQSLHFKMIFAAAEKAGYICGIKVDHVPFGLVLGADGKKFKTRSGETEKLIDLINNGVAAAAKILHERSETADPALAKALGINAIKYADLACNRLQDYTFSYDKMLKFEGNTAAFLMYAYVRTQGIKRRLTQDLSNLNIAELQVSHKSEIALGVHILQFAEIIENLLVDLLPHKLAEYLYNLAEKFNQFFRDCRVEGSDSQNSRLLLCCAAEKVLKTGLELLGLEVVEKM